MFRKEHLLCAIKIATFNNFLKEYCFTEFNVS